MILIGGEFEDRVLDALEILRSETFPAERDIRAVLKMIKSLDLIDFQEKLVRQLRTFYNVGSGWLSGLDSNHMLLGFEDCLYDFEQKQFRDGLPSDMVSMSCGHKREDVQYDQEINGKITEALENMHASRDSLTYVLNVLATSVVGIRETDRFQIWTGTGANGKGLTKNLCAAAFGSYYYEPAITLFTDRSVSGSCLSSELAKLRGKRLCITSEAEPGDKLRPGLLKQCTGHDLIQARDLYKSASEFQCVANLILMFNEVPGVEDSSEAIERRLDLIRHPHKFVDNPTLSATREENRQEPSKTVFLKALWGVLLGVAYPDIRQGRLQLPAA